jgi:L-cysteine:1D-myo-inositol 2-amino-2-deoxy-alpha-D-glucopyranoside ligase
MNMQLYNTLTRQVQPLVFADNVARMYVCGITPYDTSHLGHARVAVVYDTLRRYLQSQGIAVRYVQNITDIDDPLFERARRDGVRWDELGRQQTERYLNALRALNVQMPDHLVRVSDVIDDMLPIIEQLVAMEHAYVRDGAVFYRAASFPDFGQIAHVDAAQLLAMANEMGNEPDDPRKLDPLDFLLWQPSAPDEPAWNSPWGLGRPGWHIECSTIATKFLGPHIDVHGGGEDLIMPHHACEIAQAEPVTGAPFVRYWMHTGLVEMHGTKMSKSLGNMVFVNDLLASYPAAAVRLALLNYHYRAPFEYADVDLQRAAARVAMLERALAYPGGANDDDTSWRRQFFDALADDFNTPAALDVVAAYADALLRHPIPGSARTAPSHTLRDMCAVLGVEVPHQGKD